MCSAPDVGSSDMISTIQAADASAALQKLPTTLWEAASTRGTSEIPDTTKVVCPGLLPSSERPTAQQFPALAQVTPLT
jgi:hypothetical protein